MEFVVKPLLSLEALGLDEENMESLPQINYHYEAGAFHDLLRFYTGQNTDFRAK